MRIFDVIAHLSLIYQSCTSNYVSYECVYNKLKKVYEK